MDKPELILSVGGVAIPVGAVIVYLARSAVAKLLEQHEAILALKLSGVTLQIESIRKELDEFKAMVRTEMLPKVDSLRDATVRNSGRQDAMMEKLDRHEKLLNESLPKISAAIGQMSMYWKPKAGE